jgi:flagellar biogenesis protein FliO
MLEYVVVAMGALTFLLLIVIMIVFGAARFSQKPKRRAQKKRK